MLQPVTDATRFPLVAHLEYLRLCNHRPASLGQRAYTLRRIAKALEHEREDDLLAVTEDDLDRWQRTLADLSPRYRSASSTHARGFWRWALRSRLITADPSVVLAQVKVPRSLPHPMAQEDFDMAVNCAPERIRPWLVLAGYAGLRVGEIAGLERHHVHDRADPPVLHVIGKGGHERVVPMSERVRAELYAAGLPSRGFIFKRLDGLPGGVRPHMVSRLINTYLHELGIEETAHSCRHLFGTGMYRVSNDLRMCQEVMGHLSPSTTAGYVAWSAAAAVAAVRALPGADMEGLTAPLLGAL